jgi:phosphoglycolate phosphatase-like HAD superfamily hydrolase
MGDSVTADIAAANAAGVESILFTDGKEPPEGHGATYVARNYREALDILLAKAE